METKKYSKLLNINTITIRYKLKNKEIKLKMRKDCEEEVTGITYRLVELMKNNIFERKKEIIELMELSIKIKKIVLEDIEKRDPKDYSKDLLQEEFMGSSYILGRISILQLILIQVARKIIDNEKEKISNEELKKLIEESNKNEDLSYFG